jgi:hypothetical protein
MLQLLRIEPLTSPMINQWTAPLKDIQLLSFKKFHMFISTHHYKTMRYIGRWVGG